MRIHHIHPLVHWQRLIWFKCIILWLPIQDWSDCLVSWWLKTTHFFKYAVFKYSASSAHLWSCYEHHVWFFGTPKKNGKCHMFTYIYNISERLPKNWFRSIFPWVFSVDFFTCLLHQSLHHGFGFQSSFLERISLGGFGWKGDTMSGSTSVENPWVATKFIGKSYHLSWDLAGFFWLAMAGLRGKIQPKENELFEVSSLSCTRFWSFTCISWKKPPFWKKGFRWQEVSMVSSFNPEWHLHCCVLWHVLFICFCSACQQHKYAANSLDSKLRMSTLVYEY